MTVRAARRAAHRGKHRQTHQAGIFGASLSREPGAARSHCADTSSRVDERQEVEVLRFEPKCTAELGQTGGATILISNNTDF